MNDQPEQPGGESPDEGQNPFKGTPFEQFFSGAQGFSGGLPDLGALMGQIQSLMQPHEGPINWDFALDMARRATAQTPDPSPSSKQQSEIADAVHLADLWLDEACEFASGVSSTAAWSRAEWIVGTTDVWKVLVEPVAEHATGALGKALPEEAAATAGPLIGLLGKAAGMMVATQVGQGLGALAGEVLSASDIGLPLGPTGRAALVPANIATFAEGLDISNEDVVLYLALREAAHQRLFAHVPWLREHLVSAVREYADGIEIDTAGMEEQLRGIDPMNPQSVQDAMSGGLFDPKPSPAQTAALEKLETTLALVEGWVDEVVGQATHDRMPTAPKMQEAIRRRRAAGGPAEQAFASLVGLELRPRRLRDASTLWGSLRTRQGIEARDAVWMHPQLLPTAADLDDPLGFREDAVAPADLSEIDFDVELAKLLDQGSDGPLGEDGPEDTQRPEGSEGSEGPEGSDGPERPDGGR
jgi:putative hydrolase